MNRIWIIISVLVLSGFVLVPHSVDAATRYKITPLVIDREVDQRDMFTETITIENNSSHRLTLFPNVNEVKTGEGGDIAEFVPPSAMEDKSTGVTSWIEVTRGVTELMPGEVREIPVKFRIHQDAPSGDYQAFISFIDGQNRTIAEKKLKDGQAQGTIVTLSVAQNRTEFLKLDTFSVDRFVADESTEAIEYVLINPGEAPITPAGEIIFYNGRGDEVGAMPVNPEGKTLAPREQMSLTSTIPIENMMGKYKAFLSVDYGTTQLASVYDTAFFYVIPWTQILVLFIITLILALLLAIWLHRRYNPTVDDGQHGAIHLPLHVFDGKSEDIEHDINLKS